jgi:hypothetical protein
MLGRVDTVDAFLDWMAPSPISRLEFEGLAELARDAAAGNPELAAELGRIERMLLEEPMWADAMEERRSIGEASGGEGGRSSGSRRL